MTTYAGTELPWTGGRPWRVLDDCPARIHNTLNSARGRNYLKAAGRWKITKVPHCVCPGAKEAIRADNAARRARAVAEREKQKLALAGGMRKTARPGAWVPTGVRMPDFTHALCRTMLGIRIMDNVINGSGGVNTLAVKQAKELCTACPIRESKCKPYIMKAELPPGSLYGVWAGMTPTERRAAHGLTR